MSRAALGATWVVTRWNGKAAVVATTPTRSRNERLSMRATVVGGNGLRQRVGVIAHSIDHVPVGECGAGHCDHHARGSLLGTARSVPVPQIGASLCAPSGRGETG